MYKSLDDVIKAAECCRGVTHCSKCPYFDKRKKLIACMDTEKGTNNFITDVLQYLKNYKAGIMELPALLEE